MLWTRGWVALFALITALISLRPLAGIVELTAFSGSLYGACFFPAIIFGLHWRRGSGAAVMASFAVGIGVLLGWLRILHSALRYDPERHSRIRGDCRDFRAVRLPGLVDVQTKDVGLVGRIRWRSWNGQDYSTV